MKREVLEAGDFTLVCMFSGVFSSSLEGDAGVVGSPGPAGEKGAKGSTGESLDYCL